MLLDTAHLSLPLDMESSAQAIADAPPSESPGEVVAVGQLTSSPPKYDHLTISQTPSPQLLTVLSLTSCLEEFLHLPEAWKRSRRELDIWLKHELLLGTSLTTCSRLAQTCKSFSGVYRGDLRKIAMDWLQMQPIHKEFSTR